MRAAKQEIVLDLDRQDGATWDAIRDVRERLGIEARREMPPPPVGVYVPEQIGGVDNPSKDALDRWRSEVADLCSAVVPEEARYGEILVDQGWGIFVSMCMLYDPPANPPRAGLVAFRDCVQWAHLDIVSDTGQAVDRLPITWIEGEPYIDIKPGTTKRDVLSALAALMVVLSAGVALAASPIVGTDSGEQIKGTRHAEEIRGLGGADEITDGLGTDIVFGGKGKDNLIAYGTDTSVDRFYGGAGDDTVQSRDVPATKDRVECGPGIDHVYADKDDVVSTDCERVRVW